MGEFKFEITNFNPDVTPADKQSPEPESSCLSLTILYQCPYSLQRRKKTKSLLPVRPTPRSYRGRLTLVSCRLSDSIRTNVRKFHSPPERRRVKQPLFLKGCLRLLSFLEMRLALLRVVLPCVTCVIGSSRPLRCSRSMNSSLIFTR